MATHSTVLAWEPGGLQSLGCKRVRHDLMTKTITKYRLQSRHFLLESRVKQSRKRVNQLCLFACVLSCFSHVQRFVTLWTIAHQAPLSIGFSRPEYWSGLPCPCRQSSQPRNQTCISCLLHWQEGSLPVVSPVCLFRTDLINFKSRSKGIDRRPLYD